MQITPELKKDLKSFTSKLQTEDFADFNGDVLPIVQKVTKLPLERAKRVAVFMMAATGIFACMNGAPDDIIVEFMQQAQKHLKSMRG